MRRILFTTLMLGSLTSLALVAGSGRASLYAPDEPRFVIPVGPDGKAQALPFGDFLNRLTTLKNARDPRPNMEPERTAFRERIKQAGKKKLSADETAALAVDLFRIGEGSEALNRLSARLRDRIPNYFVFTTYANIRADGAGEASALAEALRYHETALLDSELPAEVKGLTKSQRDWWAKLDRDYVPHYYRLRMKEVEELQGKSQAEKAKMYETEDIFPLFPVPTRTNPHPQPVRFVDDTGTYRPGQLAAAERAKLPADAIPIVQQLVLWFPTDNRLAWLLAELYAAEGDFASAFSTFHSLSWGSGYGTRKVMMDHRQATEVARNAQPRKASDDELIVHPAAPDGPGAPPAPEPISMRTVWIYFGAVGVIAVFALWRALSRRMKGDCGPVG